MKTKYGWLYITATIISTIIGAGFATGQEIYAFFNVYGKWSFSGFLIVYLIFLFSFETVLLHCFRCKIDNFSEFLISLRFGKLASWTEGGIAMFSFCGYCAMASATGTLLSQTMQLPYVFGVVLMLAGCAFVLFVGIKAIAKVNFFLAPLICVGLIYFTVCGLLDRSVQTFAAEHYYADMPRILFSALLYASYNILSAVVVLCSMRSYCNNERKIRLSCLLGAGALVVIALLIWLVLAVYRSKIQLGEIPMLDIALRGGAERGILYSALLLASVFTTAIGCGFAVLGFVNSKLHISKAPATFLISLAALPVCMLGFSDIVRVLYSFFGFLGLPFLFVLLYVRVKSCRKAINKSKNMENELN